MIKKAFLGLLAGSGLLLAAGVANASILLNFDGSISTENTGSTATALFEFFNGSPGTGNVTLQITLTNTTTAPASSDLRGIFFDMASGASWDGWFDGNPNADSLVWVLGTPATLPPYGSFGLCGQTTRPNRPDNSLCNAGIPNPGLFAPPVGSDYFQLGLSGLTDAATYESAFNALFADTSSEHACVRFQNVTNAAGVGGLSDKVCAAPDGQVPVPGPLALIGLGLVGMGLMRRRVAP